MAGLIAFLGNSLLGRLSTNEARAFLGSGPERDQAELSAGLGPVGVILFVAVPLAVAGLVPAG